MEPEPRDQTQKQVLREARKLLTRSLRPVVNATGVLLHTNLGRAPLAEEAVRALQEVSVGYSNLEFDLDRGKRGLRYEHVQGLLCSLTGAESAAARLRARAAEVGIEEAVAECRAARDDSRYYYLEYELNALGYHYLGADEVDRALAGQPRTSASKNRYFLMFDGKWRTLPLSLPFCSQT